MPPNQYELLLQDSMLVGLLLGMQSSKLRCYSLAFDAAAFRLARREAAPLDAHARLLPERAPVGRSRFQY